MKTSNIYLIFSIFCFILGIVFYVQTVFIHENIHKLVYKDYGVNSSIEYNWNPFNDKNYVGITKAEGDASKCNEYCIMTHNLNEIVGYYFLIFIEILFIILSLFYYFKFLIYSKQEIEKIKNNNSIELGRVKWQFQ